MLTRLLSAIADFWRSLFGKNETKERTKAKKKRHGPDVDDVANSFYNNLMDAEEKRDREG